MPLPTDLVPSFVHLRALQIDERPVRGSVRNDDELDAELAAARAPAAAAADAADAGEGASICDSASIGLILGCVFLWRCFWNIRMARF